MSTTETRQDRAEQIRITETRRIAEDIWEIDCINESGEVRENLTVIPRQIYSPTKDMQHRGPKGVVGKYIRALAMEDDEAREKLLNAIGERHNSIQQEITDLKQERDRLRAARADLR